MATLTDKSHGDISWKYLDTELTLGNPIEDFKQYILPILSSEWKYKKLGSKTFDAGITNALYAIYDAEKGLKESGEDVVLLRVNGNGTDVLINRTDELVSLITVHRSGLSPPVYLQLRNGLCYGFVPGRSLLPQDVRDPNLMRLNARILARLHSVQIPAAFEGRPPQVWNKCDAWIKIAPSKFDDPVKQKSFVEGVGSVEGLKKELDEMKSVLNECNSPIVFCHNDLLCGNFIYNEEKDNMSVIDFEYAGPNHLAYDIGNHFCEFAGIDNVDYDLYPTEAVQKEWLRCYLQEAATIRGEERSASVTEEAVHTLYRQVNKFALSAHLFWAVWALIQAVHSSIDFDYAEYAGVRFLEYKRRKQEFLSL